MSAHFSLVFALLMVTATAVIADGSLSVYNSGGYVATFSVSYNLNGQSQSEDSGDFTLGVTKSVNIPDGASNVYLKVEEYWFPGQKTTIFTKSFDGPVQQCFKIWGTTLNPSYDSISC